MTEQDRITSLEQIYQVMLQGLPAVPDFDRLIAASAIDATREKVQAMKIEIERLRKALHEIAYTPYINYENTGEGQYGIGVCDGHRLAAQWAREALGELIND